MISKMVKLSEVDIASKLKKIAEKRGHKPSTTPSVKGLPVNNCTLVDLGEGRKAMMWDDENGSPVISFETQKSPETVKMEFEKALDNAGMAKFRELKTLRLDKLPEIGDRSIKELSDQTQIKGFLFWGNPGTGKTTLAVQIAFQKLSDNKSVSLYRWQDLLTKARSTMNTETKETISSLTDPIKK